MSENNTYVCMYIITQTYIQIYLHTNCIALQLSLFIPFPFSLCTYTHKQIYIHMYVNIYAVTGFMFVLPGLTLKLVPLTNFLCYYCRIALLLFLFRTCCLPFAILKVFGNFYTYTHSIYIHFCLYYSAVVVLMRACNCFENVLHNIHTYVPIYIHMYVCP